MQVPVRCETSRKREEPGAFRCAAALSCITPCTESMQIQQSYFIHNIYKDIYIYKEIIFILYMSDVYIYRYIYLFSVSLYFPQVFPCRCRAPSPASGSVSAFSKRSRFWRLFSASPRAAGRYSRPPPPRLPRRDPAPARPHRGGARERGGVWGCGGDLRGPEPPPRLLRLSPRNRYLRSPGLRGPGASCGKSRGRQRGRGGQAGVGAGRQRGQAGMEIGRDGRRQGWGHEAGTGMKQGWREAGMGKRQGWG